MWWVKDREILNHTVIFEDLSIPHMYLAAQGFRRVHALQAEAGMCAYVLLPVSKNILKRGCFSPSPPAPPSPSHLHLDTHVHDAAADPLKAA